MSSQTAAPRCLVKSKEASSAQGAKGTYWQVLLLLLLLLLF
jgi:hypothetical protein